MPQRLNKFGMQQLPSDSGSMYQTPDFPRHLPHMLIHLCSLKNHGVDDEVDQMFAMAAETMALPLSEKMEFDQGDSGISFGYKAAGANAVDEFGNPDTPEFLNIAQDDALAWPGIVHRTYPRTVNARMENTIVPFVKKSKAVNVVLLKILEKKCGLPEGAFLKKHADDEPSASEVRCTVSPPCKDKDRTAMGAHTDFGSVVRRTARSSMSQFDSLQSFLHNRLGGLQVMVPGTAEWQYVKVIPPKTGYAQRLTTGPISQSPDMRSVTSVRPFPVSFRSFIEADFAGDAMSIFSGGILKSNMHRVV